MTTSAEDAIRRWLRDGRAMMEQVVDQAVGQAARQVFAGTDNSRLIRPGRFADNPGALTARIFLPAGLPPGAPLVVVLHGCGQRAEDYDRGAGWSVLAARHGFALLYPQQRRANNANLCFNWFRRQDIDREGGEAASIRHMIAATIAAHRIDPARVFVTGLSAGGAMTMALIATAPELFAGAAIIAGMPYRCARALPEAVDRMAGRGYPEPEVLARMAISANHHRGPWPTLSVWQGDADRVVAPGNVELIVEQWRRVTGLPAEPDRVEAIGRHRRSVWRDAEGRTAIERYDIAGMDHGVPLGADGLGEPGPYMLAAGVSSTAVIAGGWGLTT